MEPHFSKALKRLDIFKTLMPESGEVLMLMWGIHSGALLLQHQSELFQRWLRLSVPSHQLWLTRTTLKMISKTTRAISFPTTWTMKTSKRRPLSLMKKTITSLDFLAKSKSSVTMDQSKCMNNFASPTNIIVQLINYFCSPWKIKNE